MRSTTHAPVTNWRSPPHSRWAFQNVERVVPCVPVWRDLAPGASTEAESSSEILDLVFTWNGEKRSVGTILDATSTDAFIVIKNGKLIHASYHSDVFPLAPHILFSVTKSILGLIAGVVNSFGVLSLEKDVAFYLPELRSSGFEGATIRDLLDMTAAVKFRVDYPLPTEDMNRYGDASGWGNPSAAVGVRAFLLTLPRHGNHGKVFRYCSPSSDLLSWILERVTGVSLQNLLETLLCEPMGDWRRAHIAIDSQGVARAANGFCASARDLARIGQMMLENGAVGNRQIVPERWIQDIILGGSQFIWKESTFANNLPDAWYRSNWFKYGNPVRAIGAMGAYGQALYIHLSSGTVFAKQSSQPKSLDYQMESLQRAAFDAIALRIT